MKPIDIIFSLVCGRLLGFLVGDFLRDWGIPLTIYYHLLLWLFFPFFTLFCLWLAMLVGRKFVFVFQAAKFVLVGAFATIIDLKFFEWLIFGVSILVPVPALLSKAISFLFATALKFWGNKYWTFQKHEKANLWAEVGQFFSVTLVGLLIDVGAFYYFTNILGPQFNTPQPIWLKLSVIFAGLTAALWNFTGYKFFVFKK